MCPTSTITFEPNFYKDQHSTVLYNDFGQYEAREGDMPTGNYWVILPDGRKQIVNYYVDGYFGYDADVKYEGDYKQATNKSAPTSQDIKMLRPNTNL